MKKHMVFIVNDYLPKPTANGVCVSNVVEVLKNKYNITILCQMTDCNQIQIETIQEVTIFRCLTAERQERINSKNKVRLKYIQTKKYLRDIFSVDSIDKRLTNEFFNSLKKINELNRIDYIIPVCFPFESIIAAIEFSKLANIQVIPFLFDKFAASNTRHRNKVNKKFKYKINQRLELSSFKYCNSVISSLDWKNYFDSIDSSLFSKNYVQVPTLVPVFVKIKRKIPKNELISVIFAGNVSSNMRPIDGVARVLMAYNSQYSNIKFNFYGNGDMISALKNIKKKFSDNIHVSTSIPLEELRQRYVDADILCSIGNMDISQTPSKVFEYISTGKPIVHFYRKKEDPVIEILSKYKQSICINQNADLKVQVRQLHEFSIRNFDRLNFDEIKKIYYNATPQYTAKVIEQIISKGEKKV
ncbi:hypothetical protein [Candidatus Enterococcus mansonii]|uniref:Glycosyl transferase family 1 domain-containing protein n=3 Tax=Candidatus Enterococcus mansonii TaxID=1834181 RepID=A0ABU8ID08_9ENTE